jgi:hypothetical protein
VEPKSFGQKLGIGVRVASRIAKEHLDAHTQPAAPAPEATLPPAPPTSAPPPAASATAPPTAPPVPASPAAAQNSPAEQASRAQAASFKAGSTLRQTTEAASRAAREQAPKVAAQVVQKSRGFKVGARRFGQAMWGPFAHVSSVLWSEITGVFFGLFAFYFGRGAFQYRYAVVSTAADHRKFILDLAMTVLFGYFAISSFYIARRKEKKRR